MRVDGQICYGLLLDEGVKLPWDGNLQGDIMRWWCYVALDFVPSVELFDNQGHYLDDSIPSIVEIERYFEERDSFLASHQSLPVEMLNVQCTRDPIWILAIPDSIIKSDWGYPETFNPMDLAKKAPLVWNKILTDFCVAYDIEYRGIPQWYLSSYWSKP